MGSMFDLLRSTLASRGARWIGVPLAAAAAFVALVSHSLTTPDLMNLASEPLYARGARAKPTLTLALSVEFPTVGAQYVATPRATSDDSYSPTIEYIGYFDPEACYTYNNNATASLRRFDRSADAERDTPVAPATVGASRRTCNGAGFSGNFLNWATSSAIDILRYGLTGGDRVVDDADLTVLQRAVLPNSSVSGNFWNRANFPSKILRTTYVNGAVPTTLKGSFNGDIYVANCLNRVHFGTEATGSCDSPGNNSNLGTPTGSTAPGVVSDYTGALPSDFSGSCAAENNTCTFSGTKQVAYGAGNNWKFMVATSSVACNNATFGDPINGTVKACYTRDAPATSGGLTSDPFFYARVQVCESDNSGNLIDRRTGLCQRYPNGKYKPVGNLQKYSDRVRVAAFGYLNDSPSDPQRYGGVLRAPMKYVGPKQFDANFNLVSTTNPNREWDETTGQLRANPEGQATLNSGSYSSNPGGPLSGVINYLNQFGRTGTLGQYKTYDPVGELYYESLRYIQGLQPTHVQVSGSYTVGSSAIYNSAGKEDGFPVYTSWTDPHPAVSGMSDYSCVKNNIVGIGDVNTHNDKFIPGNSRTGKGDYVRAADATINEPDFVKWTKIVGGFESNTSYTYDGTTSSNISINSPYNAARWGMETQNIGADSASYYMAGMAYWANTHDIRGTTWTGDTSKQRPGMRLTTYWLDVNEYGEQSDATRRKNNQFYLATKYGGFKDVTKTGNPFKTYTAGTTTIVDSNENWTNAAGEAKNYFLSSSAKDVLAALDQIFAAIASEANSIAGGAISTQRLTTSGGQVYQAQFDPADWSGDLVAYPVTVSGTTVSIGTLANSPWKNAANVAVGAGGKLDDLASVDARKIYVGYNATATGVFDTTEFKWASMNSVSQDLLRMPPYAASAAMDSASAGESRVNFLRGDRSLEGSTFRRRGSRLGDIINSGVAFSGAPPVVSSDSAYATFYTANKNRKKALFVGANDGMLHAFDAATGSELFSYIPSWLVPRLPALTSPSYVHASYADGTPAVAEAKVGTAWKTVLVAGTGAGGQGVFALDVSDPDAFDNSKVLWEFTDRDDVDMGNVIGHPKILKLNVSAGTSTPSYKYFAVFSSGVNNYAADGNVRSNTDLTEFGKPALFLLDLSKGKSAAWIEGTNYFKIRFPRDTSISMASGLSEFAVRLGAANELTYVYAGDLQGNLWKLDFTSTSAANWTLDNLSYFKDGSTAIPMFIAKDGAGNRQPISMEPALVFGTNRSIIVSFGTGKYMEVTDNAGPYKAQSVYTLLDNNTHTVDSASPITAAIAGRGRLMGPSTGGVTATSIDIPNFTWGRPSSDTGTVKAGWYFDFFNSDTVTGVGGRAGTGERQISGFGVLAGKLIFGTVIPALNSCDNGSGKLYELSFKAGDGVSETSSVGILGEPFLAQVGASSLTLSDTTGRRRETTRYQIILQGSGGLAAPSTLGRDVVGYPGRLSWREISNYQEVRSGS